jgi:hypothetical protein
MATIYGQQYVDRLHPLDRAPPYLRQMASAETMVPRASNPEEALGQANKHAEVLEALETCAYPDSPAAEEIVHLLQFGHKAYYKCLGLYPILVPVGLMLSMVILVLIGGAGMLVYFGSSYSDGGQLPKSVVLIPIVSHIMGIMLFFTDCWLGTAKMKWQRGCARFLVCLSLGAAASYMSIFLGWTAMFSILGFFYVALTIGCLVLMASRILYMQRRRGRAPDPVSGNWAIR